VLLGKASGTWNIETALRFSLEFRQLALSLNTSKWAHIMYLEDWQLGTPEIEPIVKKS